jgi:hypothetical protein
MGRGEVWDPKRSITLGGPTDCIRQVNARYIVSDSTLRNFVNVIPQFYNQGVHPHCIGHSLANVFLHKGLHNQAKIIADASDMFVSLQSAVQFVMKEFGGWQVQRKSNFKPLEDDNPSVMKVLQICAVPIQHYDVKMYQDNNHCIGIADGLIFDPNKHAPLRLSKPNLDLCCVGDVWVFHHVSLCYEFIPGKIVQTIIAKYKRKLTQNNNGCDKKQKL